MAEPGAVAGVRRGVWMHVRAPWLGALVLAMGLPAGLVAQADAPAGAVPVERLAARREALRAKVGAGLVLVRAGVYEGVGTHPQGSFRQDDDFFYLTGLEETGATLVGRPDQTWVLYLPEREPGREAWTGRRLGPGPEATRLTGIQDVRGNVQLAGDVGALFASASAVRRLWLGGAVPTGCTTRGGACPDSLIAAAGARRPGAVYALAPALAGLRVVKDEDEVRRLRAAAAITGAGLRAAMVVAAPGRHEYELQAALEAEFRRGGAERVGFPSIIGSGPNSTVLHYDVNRRVLRAGDLVVMDVGAEYGYYTADVTRTIPAAGQFTPRQRALYQLVLGAQRAAIAAVRPGASLPELERIARTYLREHSDTLCGRVTCDRYFIHGLSHWIGLDVHDVGPMMVPLVPGMVLTVEPGLYIPEEELGIRIEDDVLVTPAGREVLSGSAPKEPAEIETLMQAHTSGPTTGR